VRDGAPDDAGADDDDVGGATHENLSLTHARPGGYTRLLPAALSILIVAGLANLGARLSRAMLGRDPDADESAAGYVLAVAATGAFAHALALSHASYPVVLRAIAWALAAAGALHLPALASSAAALWRSTTAGGRLPRTDRLALGLCVVLLIAYGLVALGPPTDADSLTLHLAVPLEWLRSHGAAPLPEWHHVRLAGLGEALVMVGLAGGTDTLGACLQFTGLIVAARAIAAFASSRRDTIVATLLVLGCPAMLFLTNTQKFQLLPAAATTLALTLILRRSEEIDAPRLWLAFGSVAFAIGCKYSFLFSGGIVLLAGLLVAHRRHRLLAAAAIGTVLLAVIAGPIYGRNWSFYGDPLSPFLESFRAHPDPAVVEFADIQREPQGVASRLTRVATLPAGLIVPLRLGGISEPLGIGVLFVFAAAMAQRTARRLVAAAGAVTALALLFGQPTPRFFLEPYFWFGAAAFAGRSRLRSADALLIAQASLVAAAAVYMAALIAPGALNDRLRDRVMTTMAVGYQEARWIDATVPRDAVLLSSARSYALLPRPFVASDLFKEGAIRTEAEARQFAAAHGVTAIAFELDLSPPLAAFMDHCAHRLGERSFTPAARNPWNRDGDYTVVAAEIDWTRDGCRP
jgi:hypothetical protein